MNLWLLVETSLGCVRGFPKVVSGMALRMQCLLVTVAAGSAGLTVCVFECACTRCACAFWHCIATVVHVSGACERLYHTTGTCAISVRLLAAMQAAA
jgi:hypothetical protein